METNVTLENVETHADDNNTFGGMDMVTLKLVTLAFLFITTFSSSLLPLRIVSTLRNTLDPDKRTRYARIISLLNCFGGGVFLATAFLDLLPEVVQDMHQALPNSTFPFAEFIVAFGFFLVLTTEQVILDCRERVIDSLTPIQRLEARNKQLDRDSNLAQEDTLRTNLIVALQGQDVKPQSVFHSFFLLGAISLHSIFEGIALGFQRDVTNLLQIFFAVLIHKIPVAFSIGLNIIQSELKIKSVIQLDLWFSLMTPIGIVISLIFEEFESDSKNSLLLNAVAQALATGMFVFITFIEILPKELKRGRNRLLHLLFMIFGFSSVCGSVILETRNIV